MSSLCSCVRILHLLLLLSVLDYCPGQGIRTISVGGTWCTAGISIAISTRLHSIAISIRVSNQRILLIKALVHQSEDVNLTWTLHSVHPVRSGTVHSCLPHSTASCSVNATWAVLSVDFRCSYCAFLHFRRHCHSSPLSLGSRSRSWYSPSNPSRQNSGSNGPVMRNKRDI